MFSDDQYTRYVNVRFPAIGARRWRKTKEIVPPKTPFVLLAPVEPNSDMRKDAADQTAPPYSEAA